MSASSKCLECSETADSFEFLLLAHAIKANVGCASTSSKCTYVLNANSKGPGETAHLRKCAESSELLLLEYASIACLRVRNECELQGAFNRALARLLVQLWFYFCTGLALA